MAFHPQEDHHCGPASLLTLLDHAGVRADYASVVERVYVPGLEGSLQIEMAAAGRSFGRLAYALPPEPAAVLAEVAAGRPVLVLLNLGVPSSPVWHYAVVVGFDPAANRFVLRSGAERRLLRKAPVWLRQWDWAGRWALVLLAPGEWPAAPRRDRLLRALADFEEIADAASAGRAWRRAAAAWPDEPLAWLGVGNAAYRREAWDDAAEAYRHALSLDPEHLPARLNLAQAEAEGGSPCSGLAVLGPPPAAGHPLLPAFAEVREMLRRRCAATRAG
ncbi:MAG: PA2778 family cysteine peptidase [Acidobacteriota bacterium]|nr:PA2778 family cysteine peptidase [Acidobacteriota bacterium]MDH3523969.1 PA2778 family cysteine peptidase [Acidobacteriota bacterium]